MAWVAISHIPNFWVFTDTLYYMNYICSFHGDSNKDFRDISFGIYHPPDHCHIDKFEWS